MNRLKKEQNRRYVSARNGLTKEEILQLDNQDKINKVINDLARTLHVEKFPEEYDFMYDSFEDAKDRKKGINPMNKEYQEKVRLKREKSDVLPLNESGMSNSNETMALCIQEAKKIICAE